MNYQQFLFSKNARSKNELHTVIDQGIKMMNNNLSEQNYRVWFDYSISIIDICFPDNQYGVKSSYLQVFLELQNTSSLPYQKINYCIKYLLEVLKHF